MNMIGSEFVVLDLRGEHRAKAVLPEPDGLVADVDTSFKQDVFDLAQ
jgi:hypothetical protein